MLVVTLITLMLDTLVVAADAAMIALMMLRYASTSAMPAAFASRHAAHDGRYAARRHAHALPRLLREYASPRVIASVYRSPRAARCVMSARRPRYALCCAIYDIAADTRSRYVKSASELLRYFRLYARYAVSADVTMLCASCVIIAARLMLPRCVLMMRAAHDCAAPRRDAADLPCRHSRFAMPP